MNEARTDDQAGIVGNESVIERISEGEETFERWRRRSGIVLAPMAFFIGYHLGDGLKPEGRKLGAILAAVIVLWITELLPLPVTAIFGAAMCIVLGVADAKVVLSYFADPIVFVFIGGFMLARGMMIHQLDRRIALGVLSLRWVGSSPARTLVGMGLVTAVISMWVSNTATTAMMLPIALGVLAAQHQARVSAGLASGPMDARRWPYATAMMLMLAYGASIGGIGTPVGSPPNLIGIAQIRQSAGVEIGFFQWMAIMLPIFAIMAAVLFVLLHFMHRTTEAGVPAQTAPAGNGGGMLDYLRDESAKLGAWRWGQINTLIAFGVAVALWILPGVLALMGLSKSQAGQWISSRLPEAVVAMIAAVLLFVLPTDLRRGRFTLTWDQAVKIDWGTILLFGGGLSLGALMFQTGVATALGDAATSKIGVSSLWSLTGLAIAVGIVLSETTSNTASANMVIPVVIALAKAAGVNPVPPALGACLGASFGFMLPVSTPPNAIVYGSGLVPLPRMVRAGLVFDVLGFFVIWAGLRVLCPIMGMG